MTSSRIDIGPAPIRPDATLTDSLRMAGVATVVEALGPHRGFQQTMSEGMRRRTTSGSVAGPAVTAANVLSDNLAMHVALEIAQPGDVLVVTGAGPYGASWGELVTVGAKAKRIAAAVVDGSIRDCDEIEKAGFAVWATHIRPFGASKHGPAAVLRPVLCAGVHVQPGDIVVADGDGVVVVPTADAEEVARIASERVARENVTRDAARSGVMPGRSMGHLDGLLDA